LNLVEIETKKLVRVVTFMLREKLYKLKSYSYLFIKTNTCR